MWRGRLAVCLLEAGDRVPGRARSGGFSSVSRTTDGTSIVCEENLVPAGVRSDKGWRAFQVAGPLDFNLAGILLSIAQPLADAGVGIFAISIYDTELQTS